MWVLRLNVMAYGEHNSVTWAKARGEKEKFSKGELLQAGLVQ